MINFTNKNLHIAVILGGESAERNVSLRSGKAVIQAIKSRGLNATPIDGLKQLLTTNLGQFDAVFNILHGGAGENGDLAGLLSSQEIRYTGCDATGAVLSWHKDVAKTLVSKMGLKTPASQTLFNADDLKVNSQGPWIVKPTQEGSSVGLYFVKNKKELKETVVKALKEVDSILVEQFIQGEECTVSIIKNQVLPVIRIKPAVGLYDYEAKYRNNTTEYFCPSGFDKDLEQALKNDALIAFKTLLLKGWARVDFIVDKKGNRWFLEANTTPGMTETSLVPKAAQAINWEFDELVMQILSSAFSQEDYSDE